MKRIFPSSFYNPVTLTGAAISSVSFGLILFLIILEIFGGFSKPYMGIIAFVILPGILLTGIAVMVAGIWRTHRRQARGEQTEFQFPAIDLNVPHQRRAFFAFSLGGILLLMFSAFGSFKAYEYTDSDQFCGEMCHAVMEPEYTAYQDSPHARVGCVQCHIGPGADWFVRSKFSGAYQVYATIFDKYPRPIPTPIENLRPAQETCETCHWPQHFFSKKEKALTYFLSDEENTRWHLTLLMNIGGGSPETGSTDGIHWHMNIANEVTYVATDRQRLTIPWVKVKNRATGVERVYRSTTADVTDEEIASAPKRSMDCIDCHNRPTHIYHPPFRTVNSALTERRLSSALPYIKSVAVEALEKPYSTREAALDSIGIVIREYYAASYPAIARDRSEEIEQAVAETQRIYRRNYFPEMKHDWRQYPDHIGHMFAPGCFRCHDGNHVSDDGKVITNDCNTCHTILVQQFQEARPSVSLEGLTYRHPVDIGDAWKEMLCSECHAAPR